MPIQVSSVAACLRQRGILCSLPPSQVDRVIAHLPVLVFASVIYTLLGQDVRNEIQHDAVNSVFRDEAGHAGGFACLLC